MINLNALAQIIGTSRNPQEAVLQLIQGNGNPFFANLATMAKSGDAKGLEEVARNMAKEKGLDFDTEFAKFKNNYRL